MLSRRIKTFCQAKGLTVKSFETQCGLSNGYVRNISGSIGKDKIMSICREFPDLNIGWLMTGDGEMLMTSKEQFSLSDHSIAVGGDAGQISNGTSEEALLAVINDLTGLVRKSQEQVDRYLSIIENLQHKGKNE